MTGETGVLYQSPTIEGLARAISDFESNKDTFHECVLRARAAEFSQERFLERFEHILSEVPVQTATMALAKREGQAEHRRLSAEAARPR